MINIKELNNDLEGTKIKSLSFAEKTLFLLLCVLWTHKTLVTGFLVVLNRIPIIGFIFEPSIVIPLIILVLVAFSFKVIWSRTSIILLAIYFVLVFISLITLLIDSPLNEPFNEIAFTFLLECVPMIFIGNAAFYLLKKKISIRYFYYLSVLSLFYLIALHYYTGSRLQHDWESSMYTAYLILPHLLMIINGAFEQTSVVGIFSAIIGTVFLVMQGTRGAVTCLGFFLMVNIVWYVRRNVSNIKIGIPFIFGMVVFIVIFANYYDSLFLRLYSFARAEGYSIRVLDFLRGSTESGSVDSGRYYLYSTLLQAIKDNPFGYGFGADAALSGFTYAHNLFLQIIIEYGIFIGSLILVFLITILVKSLLNKNLDLECRKVILIIVTVGFVKLMVSGTYLTDPFFFLCVGMCLPASKLKGSYSASPKVGNVLLDS